MCVSAGLFQRQDLAATEQKQHREGGKKKDTKTEREREGGRDLRNLVCCRYLGSIDHNNKTTRCFAVATMAIKGMGDQFLRKNFGCVLRSVLCAIYFFEKTRT